MRPRPAGLGDDEIENSRDEDIAEVVLRKGNKILWWVNDELLQCVGARKMTMEKTKSLALNAVCCAGVSE